MSILNHPLKRLSFILFICSGTLLIALATLPTPFEVSSYAEWKDTAASEVPGRRVTRIDTKCAATRLGGLEVFARDFFIVDAHSSESEFSRLLAEVRIEQGTTFNITPTIDITEKEKAVFFSATIGVRDI